MKDLQLYESRLKPLDVIDVDEEQKLAGLSPPLKRSATDFQVDANLPARVYKNSDAEINSYQTVIVFNWNSGSTPLDSWLNQSAIPSLSPTFQKLCKEDTVIAEDPVAREIKEIKVFRNVHISLAPEPSTNPQIIVERKQVRELKLNTQIYYRNIIDRYPGIPAYLVLRLARANYNRADRLRRKKDMKSKDLRSTDFSAGNLNESPSKATQKVCKCIICGITFS